MDSRSYLRGATIRVLGGTQAPKSQPSEPTEKSEESWWKKFKTKVKNAWDTVKKVARDIIDYILPIVDSTGDFLGNWATFCNRNSRRQRSVQHGYHYPAY